ncbi:MAG: efflux RND transporter permease subunit [Gammaproteobacteria bacterium]|nr:efflux RND transporter permease subunit [Gammaproteobacteria bacterium]
MSSPLGLSGILARFAVRSPLTPFITLTGLLLGVVAVMFTPREEEPQIDVTFANVYVTFPGAAVDEVETLVSTRVEQLLAEIEGVEHVYSLSAPGRAVLTVEFETGEPRTDAIVRLYNKVFSNLDWLGDNLGIPLPLIQPMGIDDVPILTLTLWTDDPDRAGYELQKIAHTVESELQRVPGTRDISTIGGPDRVVRVVLDPVRLAGYGIAVTDLRAALLGANRSAHAGALVTDNQELLVDAGRFLTHADEVQQLVVGVHDGQLVYLRDVATVEASFDQPDQYVWFATGPAAESKGIRQQGKFPAVTMAVGKQAGTNAAVVTRQVIERFEQLRGTFVPEGVHVTVTRDLGATADDKAKVLISKLAYATLGVIVLVLVSLGWREALVVGGAVIITLALTLFASWAYGFTLNRVSLFALIFAIGILVDDAIVVVENIHRHLAQSATDVLEAIPKAVDEIGGPTILATMTLVASLLPMVTIGGFMGPYILPLPVNSSMGMVISLLVALAITPWLARLFMAGGAGSALTEEMDTWVMVLFRRLVGPFLLTNRTGRLRRRGLFLLMLLLVLFSVGLMVSKTVLFKMMPPDNKPEFLVLVDLPEGSSLEQTERLLAELGEYLSGVAEVTDFETYAGTASPINFNGLVRQYYLREGAHMGDIQVNLLGKHDRERHSHEIAKSVRQPLQEIGVPFNANIKIVEVPPGPPLQAALVAEIYSIDTDGQARIAERVRELFEQDPEVVDVDDSLMSSAPKLQIEVDRQKAALHGVTQAEIVQTLAVALGGDDVTYLHTPAAKYPVPVRLEYAEADKSELNALLGTRIRGTGGEMVPIMELVSVRETTREPLIYHKDLLRYQYVTGEVGGAADTPLYSILDIYRRIATEDMGEYLPIRQYLTGPPELQDGYSLKWDGEWRLTYEVFRDLSVAYLIGLLLIYLLVVSQTGSYLVPAIIMAPIPLTLVGVVPGHWLMGADFTAPSMIGLVALAGIIVRNSILLVDFIDREVKAGMSLPEAVIRSGAVRAKPIILTGLAAMFGAYFILDDSIFNGLAISLIYGVMVSTLLSLVLIPVMYYAYRRRNPVLPGSREPDAAASAGSNPGV